VSAFVNLAMNKWSCSFSSLHTFMVCRGTHLCLSEYEIQLYKITLKLIKFVLRDTEGLRVLRQ